MKIFLSVKNEATCFVLYIFFQSSFFRCQEHKCQWKKTVPTLWASQNYILYAGAFVFLQIQHCFSGSTLESPCPQQVIHISTSVFSVKSFCILCRAQEGCGLLFTFKWGKLAFAWFLQYNAYFTFKCEKKGGNKPQHIRWVICFILVQASALFCKILSTTLFQDAVWKFNNVKRLNSLHKEIADTGNIKKREKAENANLN